MLPHHGGFSRSCLSACRPQSLATVAELPSWYPTVPTGLVRSPPVILRLRTLTCHLASKQNRRSDWCSYCELPGLQTYAVGTIASVMMIVMAIRLILLVGRGMPLHRAEPRRLRVQIGDQIARVVVS